MDDIATTPCAMTRGLRCAAAAIAVGTLCHAPPAQPPAFHPDFRLHGNWVGTGKVAFQWWEQQYYWVFGWHESGSPTQKTIEVEMQDGQLLLNQLQDPAPATVMGWGRGKFTLDGTTKAITYAVSATPFGASRQSGRLSTRIMSGEKSDPMLLVDLWYFESGDGKSLRLDGLGRTLTFTKNTAGNAAPSVLVTPPPQAQVLQIYVPYTFTATITDDGPGNLPDDRVVWWLRRKGATSGGFAPTRGRGLTHTFVNDGDYEVFCQAHDQGGRRGYGKADVHVAGQAPNTPVIVQPHANGTYHAGVPIVLQGTVWDQEDGALTGASLTWKANGTPIGLPQSGPTVPGTLPLVPASPRTATLPQGSHQITLEATDSTGLTSPPAFVTIQVQPYAGSSPPQIAIVEPDVWAMTSPNVTLHAGKNDPLPIVTLVTDLESPTSALTVEWFVTDRPTSTQAIVPLGPVKATGLTYRLPYSESGQAASSNKVVVKRLVVRATDPGGLSAEVALPVVFFGKGFTVQ